MLNWTKNDVLKSSAVTSFITLIVISTVGVTVAFATEASASSIVDGISAEDQQAILAEYNAQILKLEQKPSRGGEKLFVEINVRLRETNGAYILFPRQFIRSKSEELVADLCRVISLEAHRTKVRIKKFAGGRQTYVHRSYGAWSALVHAEALCK